MRVEKNPKLLSIEFIGTSHNSVVYILTIYNLTKCSLVIVTFVNDKWKLFCIKVNRNEVSSPFHLIYFLLAAN